MNLRDSALSSNTAIANPVAGVSSSAESTTASAVRPRPLPRRGYAFSLSLSERFYGLRNEFYRAKRRRAAKKFEVYMRKQNRDVHFDKNGRYVEPEDRDPNDKRWMN